ncbi:hypothetical protein CFN58_04710, partial [Pseudomonas avellanae]
LRRLSQTIDGQLAISGDPDAIARIAPKVDRLVDTMRVGLVNADLHTNAPIGMVADDIRPGINAFFKGASSYDQKLASQIDAVPTLQRPRTRLVVNRPLRAARHIYTSVRRAIQQQPHQRW